MTSPYPVKKGQDVEVEIETLAAGGSVGYAQTVAFATLIFAQLWHVGRVSHPSFLGGATPVAPSAVPLPPCVPSTQSRVTRCTLTPASVPGVSVIV